MLLLCLCLVQPFYVIINVYVAYAFHSWPLWCERYEGASKIVGATAKVQSKYQSVSAFIRH